MPGQARLPGTPSRSPWGPGPVPNAPSPPPPRACRELGRCEGRRWRGPSPRVPAVARLVAGGNTPPRAAAGRRGREGGAGAERLLACRLLPGTCALTHRELHPREWSYVLDLGPKEGPANQGQGGGRGSGRSRPPTTSPEPGSPGDRAAASAEVGSVSSSPRPCLWPFSWPTSARRCPGDPRERAAHCVLGHHLPAPEPLHPGGLLRM